jgi:hypothetical protein
LAPFFVLWVANGFLKLQTNQEKTENHKKNR